MVLRLSAGIFAGLACLALLAPPAADAAPKPKAKKPAVTHPAPASPKIHMVDVANPPPPKNDPPRATFGSWGVRCARLAKDKPEDCALTQIVAGTKQGEQMIGLTVIVPKAHGGKVQFARVIAPGGVFLPPGVGLAVDGTDIGHVGYQYCLPAGCIAEFALDPRLMQTFRSGKTATFAIARSGQEVLGIPVSLNGFGQGIDALP